jgi:ethanolamine utilization protein EutQ
MKKLISIKEIENLISHGEKIFYIDNNAIITPAAKDMAKINGIKFSADAPACEVKDIKCSETKKNNLDKIDREMIYRVFKTMDEKGLLEEFSDSLSKISAMHVHSSNQHVKIANDFIKDKK